MKKTFREKVISRCTGMIKKNKWLKIPVMIYMTVVLAVYHAGLKIAANGKRYSCAAFCALLLVVNSSFAVPSADGVSEEVVIMEDGVALAAEQEINTEEVASIEADVAEIDTFDEEEFEYLYMSEEEVDTFTLEEILEDNDVVIETKTEDEKSATLVEAASKYADYEFDPDDWRLILVNKQHKIPDDYEFPLGNITSSGSMQCDERIIADLLTMMQDAKDEGVDLVICSPYRDFNRQTYLFEKKVNRYMNAGMSYLDAYKIASVSTTAPNASEHQIGLAIDFYSSTYMRLDEGFENTEAGIWLAENSYKYGFILRYPKGKEYITGIIYEPWHFRYVGVEAAAVITERGVTLEEFWEDLY